MFLDTNGEPVAPGMTVGNYATAGLRSETRRYQRLPSILMVLNPGAASGMGPSARTRGDSSIRYFILREPTYDKNNEWPQAWQVDFLRAPSLVRERTRADAADDPRKLHEFLRQGRKVILYHGFSDDMASPFRSVVFSKALARHEHGYARLQEHARLFMVPGMGHCSGGGGPNSFDTLTALDNLGNAGRRARRDRGLEQRQRPHHAAVQVPRGGAVCRRPRRRRKQLEVRPGR